MPSISYLPLTRPFAVLYQPNSKAIRFPLILSLLYFSSVPLRSAFKKIAGVVFTDILTLHQRPASAQVTTPATSGGEKLFKPHQPSTSAPEPCNPLETSFLLPSPFPHFSCSFILLHFLPTPSQFVTRGSLLVTADLFSFCQSSSFHFACRCISHFHCFHRFSDSLPLISPTRFGEEEFTELSDEPYRCPCEM